MKASREKWLARREEERKTTPTIEPDFARALRGAKVIEVKGSGSSMHSIVVEKDGRRFALSPDHSAVIIVELV